MVAKHYLFIELEYMRKYKCEKNKTQRYSSCTRLYICFSDIPERRKKRKKRLYERSVREHT